MKTSIAPFSSISRERIMQTKEVVQENQAANFQQTKSLELEAAVADATALFSITKLDDEDLAVLSYKPCKAAKARAAAAAAKAKKKEEESPSSIASPDHHDKPSARPSTASADASKKRKTSDAVDEHSSEGSTNQTLRNDDCVGGAAWSTGQTMQQ